MVGIYEGGVVMIKKYRKIALIEAMQYTENNTREILEWINENNKYENKNKDINFLIEEKVIRLGKLRNITSKRSWKN